MKKSIFVSFVSFCLMICNLPGQNIFSVQGNQTYLNDRPIQCIGLRCSNALLSDQTTDDLISHLDFYKEYGLNTISVYFMGSRYSNICGFHSDGSIDGSYLKRMAKIIKACDRRQIVVLVGILYWGTEMRTLGNRCYSKWKQAEVNAAMQNTAVWLQENNFRNVFIDPDNEGMAERGASFNIDEMICVGKEWNPDLVIAYNNRGFPPPCADLPIHFGRKTNQMPYIQTEGTPSHYWGDYSKEEGLDHYINVGMYTEGKKAEQLAETAVLLKQGYGYLLASTWLQNVPPNYEPGGDGSPCDPGISWWLDFVKNFHRSQ